MRILIVLALLVAGLIPSALVQAAPPLGADMIAPGAVDWDQQRARFRTMRGEIIRFRIPVGFGGSPQHVEELIADGARTVILTTEDCDFTPQRTRADLVDRGFYALTQKYPHIQFIVEIGNETNICGMDPWVARFWMLRTRQELRDLDRHNLQWMVSLPTILRDTEIILSRQSDGAIADIYDAIALHLYGDWHVYPIEDHYEWGRILRFVLETTNLPVYVTEIGINDHATPKTVKAQRILEAIDRLPARVQGVTVFAISDRGDTRWPQYFIDDAMASVFATRSPAHDSHSTQPCRFFVQTGQPLCWGFRDFWERHGGVMIFGYPLTGELIENGRTVQYFERAVFEYHPENPEPYRVLLRRLGAEALERRR